AGHAGEFLSTETGCPGHTVSRAEGNGRPCRSCAGARGEASPHHHGREPQMKFKALLAAAGALVATPALAETVVIHAGAVVTDADSAPRGPSTITVTDGRIVSIADGIQPAPAGAEVVALTDKTVLPGLIDLHVHLTGDPGGDFWKEAVEPEEWGVVAGAKNARLTALAGSTTVREAGRAQHTGFALRRGTAEGTIPGPRIIAAGPALSIVGGHGDVSGFRPEINQLLTSG